MDWNRAIEINQAALTRIVTGLIVMVGLSSGGALARIPHPLYRTVSRLLRPAESAVRRLIVIAARGLEINFEPARPMPKGLALAGAGGGRISFQLFDSRKRFGRARLRRGAAKLEPRIHFFDSPFQPRPIASPAPKPDETVSAQRLGRRLAAVRMALENLPRQARRLARLQARRDRMQNLRFRSPLRPGLPPGYRKEPEEEVDWVLKECHALARDALNEDTS